MTQAKESIGNWGRWGDDDERGTLNLLTPEVVRAAAGSIKSGKVYNLGLPIQQMGMPTLDYRNPPMRLSLVHSADEGRYAQFGPFAEKLFVNEDFLMMASHNETHMDPLCHAGWDGTMYNGFGAETAQPNVGATKLGIDKVKAVVGRMVLLDVAGHYGVNLLGEDRTFITSADLEATAAAQGVEVRAGDIVLIRTGWVGAFFNDQEAIAARGMGQSGLGLDGVEFMRKHDVAAVGADNTAVEGIPFDENRFMSVHVEMLRNDGRILMELLNLEELAQDKVYEGFFACAPLVVTGGMGSPVNPIVIG